MCNLHRTLYNTHYPILASRHRESRALALALAWHVAAHYSTLLECTMPPHRSVASQVGHTDLQQLLHGIPLAPRHAELLHLDVGAYVRRIIEHSCSRRRPAGGSHGGAKTEWMV